MILKLQFKVFYAVRLFLGLLSVITEATLVVALSRKYGKRLGSYTLAMLCLTSGCFFASTSAYASLHAILFLVFCNITFLFLHKMVLLVTVIVYIFFSCRFLAKFIFYVCYFSVVSIISF